MKTIKQIYKHVTRVNRIRESLASNLGIKVQSVRHLDRLSNVVLRGGRLQDATCHYVRRFEVSGNTYPLRNLLSKWGLVWDEGKDCWWIKAKPTVDELKIAERLLRVVAKRNIDVGVAA